MSDTRRKNTNWLLEADASGRVTSSVAQVAVLMDIRDELQTLNRILNCGNFLDIPFKLDAIKKNTAKRKYTRKTKKS